MSSFLKMSSILEGKKQTLKLVKRRLDKKIGTHMSEIVDDRFLLVPLYAGRGMSEVLQLKTMKSQKIRSDAWNNVYDLREDQIPIFRGMMDALNDGGCILNAYTGFGKTVVAIKAICDTAKLTIVIAHDKTMCGSWKNSIRRLTDLSCADIHDRGDLVGIDVLISTPGMLRHIPDDVRIKCGFVLVDEADLIVTDKRLSALIYTHPSTILFLSATISDREMRQLCFFVPGRNLIKVNYNGPLSVTKVVTNVWGEMINNKSTRKLDWHAYVGSLTRNERRNKMITAVALGSEKCIILTESRAHVDCLVEMLGNNCSRLYQNDSEYIERQVLVGTFSKIGRGFDESSFCDNFSGVRSSLLILATPVRGDRRLRQAVGRILRSQQPEVIHFVDGGPMANKQWEACVEIYRSIAENVNFDVAGNVNTESKEEKKRASRLRNELLEINRIYFF